MPDVNTADVVFPAITGVTIASPPVVSFRLVDSRGLPLKGLKANQVRFAIAQLVPGTGGKSSEWKSYISRNVAPLPGFEGTATVKQANTETGADARFTDNGDGTYTYRFSFDINAVSGVPYDATLTHRVALQISLGDIPVDNNAAYTWQPSSGATTGIFTREIVDNDTCNACHDGLAFHGGGRKDTQYCVTCHNPGSTDPESTNTVDMKALIHRIHLGDKNPTKPYYIVGYGGNVYDYSHIVWTQDIRNCQTCHEESDSDTPDASNWRTVQNAAACGTCHNNVNFETGEGHAAGPVRDDSCVTCHGPDSTIGGGAYRVEVVHRIPTVEAGKQFQFNVLSVTNTAPGQFPVVKFSVTDPTNGNAAWNIHTDAPFTQCAGGASRLSVDIAWTTKDYSNGGSGVNPGQPVQINPLAACGGASTNNGDGTFSVTSPVAVPAWETGSLIAALEGHPALDADGNGTIDRIAVTNALRYAAITDATPQPRRQKVDIVKCDECHKQLSLHGNNRTDKPEVCVTCHNPNATDITKRVAGTSCETVTGTLDDQSIDMKYMIHRIHGSGQFGPYGVCGFGNSGYLFDVTYVGKINNCEGCHVPSTSGAPAGYYPVDSLSVAGTTFDANDLGTFNDDAVTSPNAAVCSSCHMDPLVLEHMKQNGSYFKQIGMKDAVTGKMLPGGSIETCSLCHGPGGVADLRDAHGIGAFEVYNVRDND
ncbi:MAG: OmcA/MtrC family decaheme c-type cytochrome [Betaproteobacteria bacterium]|nr:OmcA/MtrC family decaheme c-type cytochrome [Betaproteobacteria bacterium]